jgi:hypothetical protein
MSGIICLEDIKINKDYSASISVTEEEPDRRKHTARLEAYASYSEFVRRAAFDIDFKSY